MNEEELKRLAILVADELEKRQAARPQHVHHHYPVPLPVLPQHHVGPYAPPRPAEVWCGSVSARDIGAVGSLTYGPDN